MLKKQNVNNSAALHCFVPLCIVLYCIVLYCIVLFCITLYYTEVGRGGKTKKIYMNLTLILLQREQVMIELLVLDQLGKILARNTRLHPGFNTIRHSRNYCPPEQCYKC